MNGVAAVILCHVEPCARVETSGIDHVKVRHYYFKLEQYLIGRLERKIRFKEIE